MAEVKDIGNLEAMQLYAHIYRTLTEVSASWNVFKQLFLSGEDNIYLMNQAASGAFTTIQRSMYGYVILEIAKLVEPAWFGKHENLSILRLEELLRRTHPQDAKRISATWAAICTRIDPVRGFRNKRIAHPARVAAGEFSCTPAQVDDALKAVIDVMRSVDPVFDQGYVLWEEPLQQGDGNQLLWILENWKASHGRHHRGMLFSYFDKQKQIDPNISAKLSRKDMTGGSSVADDLVYQVYGYIEGEMISASPRKRFSTSFPQ